MLAMSDLDSSSSSDSEASPPGPVETVKRGKSGRGRPSRQKVLPSKYKDTLNDKEELKCDLTSKPRAILLLNSSVTQLSF